MTSVNFEKTRGKWKDRQDKPIDINWTYKNIKALGVYFGNDNPAKQTFDEIVPKIEKSMNFWKQFRLSTFGKARITEIFHASRLWYAANVYDIPNITLEHLQKSFFNYINYPHSTPTISEKEMLKLREDGGAKLVDIKTKIETYRIKWLMEITDRNDLQLHRKVITSLIGPQKGGLRGIQLFFTTKIYISRIFKTQSNFYKRAIQAIMKLNVKKKIEDPTQENVFYNPTFLNTRQSTIPVNLTCSKNNIHTYGQVLTEYEKKQNQQPHNRHIANIYTQITHKDLQNRSNNIMYNSISKTFLTFNETTHKMVYQELIKLNYKEHHSKASWEERLISYDINWDKVWQTVHNPLSSEETRTIIWEQIHLNDYTTYSYNKWHSDQQKCPFCSQVPENKFHITIECPALNTIWVELEQHLLNIHPARLTNAEKVFGIPGHSPDIRLRNWLTFLLRQCITHQENKAFYNKKGQCNNLEIKLVYNQRIKSELWNKYNILSNLGRSHHFSHMFSVNDYLMTWENENWQVLTLFTVQ